MRKLFSLALLAGLLAFSSEGNAQQQGKGKGAQGGGFGQRGQGGGMFGGGGGRATVASLAVNASVQEEIKATDEQKEKLKTISEEQAAKITELNKEGAGDRGSLKDLGREEMLKKMQERQKEMAPKMTAIREESEKKIGEVLKPEQLVRVKQISHQQMGMAIFTDEATAKELKISDEQKEKLKVISEEYAKDQRELRGGGRSPGGDNKGGDNKGTRGQGKGGFGGGFGQVDPETQKKLDALKTEYMDKAVAVLNDEQKGIYKKMTGDVFAVKFEPRRAAPKKDD